MSLRQPSSTLDSPFAVWLSSLTIGDSERRSSGSQQRELLTDVPAEGSSPGLVQRCVIVQKDQLGFGFTVCGERVKLVQNVRPGGAAVKAGVQEGDRIIKVNGSLVSSMTHQEVVKLIKSGPYVALTLQGPPPSAASLPLEPLPSYPTPNQRTSVSGEAPPPPPFSSTPSQRITLPTLLQDPEVQKHASQILRKMLEQEEAELQDLMDEQLKNPSPSLEERIESAKRRAHQVRIKIQQDVEGTRSESTTSYMKAGEGRLSLDSGEGDMEPFESPHSSPSFPFRNPHHRRQSSDTHSDTAGKAQIIGPEEEDEEDDGYAFNEMDGPFQDIELLKSRPAHMTVFMRYVFTQLLDPNPLLFYLSVEAYLSSSPKDARALAPQICSHFLDPDAPLKIKVREEYLSDIESRLHAQEDIRGPLSELQQQVLPDIQDQIQDYRNKQMMGLGSLFGEGDLRQLDGDPAKERQVVDRQVSALWEVLSKHEEDRSSPLASAVHLYLRHSGIKLRDSRIFPGLSTEKDKWLAFLKTRKTSGLKKEKDGEDKKRNPILKYIGKPRSTSQSTFHVPLSPTEVRPGSVKNIIQHFENHSEDPGEEGGGPADPQQISSSSLGEEGPDSPMVSVRLARSGSLKAQGEGRRRGGTPGAESVPRSRSDVDMEDCSEEREQPGLRSLHHSASSASSSSARSVDNPTPPYTPRTTRRRSVDSSLALLPDAALPEEELCDAQNWQDTVPPLLLAELSSRETDRQAVIYELYTTEVSHLRTLWVLDKVFLQKMRSVLNSEELACIFPNLPKVHEFHANLCEAMKKRREIPVVQEIGDVLLARFEGAAGEEFQEQASQLCCLQSQAQELIKNKKRKDPRFAQLIQECEASPLCRRLQLKDMLVSEMQRLTKYPLLLDNIIKYTDASSADLPALQQAQACCRRILQNVNENVRESEQQQRLSQYQRRLDPGPQFKSLDLTTKRMIHEGSLTWKMGKDKQLEVLALLLSDFLVLLQKGPDDRLQLRYPTRWLGGGGGASGDSKTSFSPLLKLDSLLVRPVATDAKALYAISTTETQIYELVATSASEINNWIDLLQKAIRSAGGCSPLSKVGSVPSTTSSVPAVAPGNHIFEDNSEPGQSDSLEIPSAGDDIISSSPTDQSGALNGDEGLTSCVAEEALKDVETLRRLILRDLGDDGWSHDSDNTPTNETANGGSPNAERQHPESLETVLRLSTDEWESEPEWLPPPPPPQPSVCVVRKAVVVGPPPPPPPPPPSSSVPDGITDVGLLCDRSSQSRGDAPDQGNTFYLVMPSEQGETGTDDASDPTTPTAPAGESPQLNHSEAEGAGLQRLVIRNADEIFLTIEELMSKLKRLKEIERAHHQLLESLRDPSVAQEWEEPQSCSLDVPGARSTDCSSGEDKDGSPEQAKILSTGF